MPYKKGDRVALVHTTDPYTDLTPGDEGTVCRYDANLSQLSVNWDSGSKLSMLLDDGDEVRPA
ncbi:DUF4314 domain-containing protein [Streptomyces triticiradicis]|uniref:DUF4314 domain-containing protein n=1 Tax=Streptomyces triticiradicis TaxID=2651189 RepID=A0A7J5DM77_9ACTN|nr:DUF4314 domain-containing protein [Streptomyces triticiradicis]KAB1989833.1 DUF4314 domain-containing protein [Streptomyces triticiradicis]